MTNIYSVSGTIASSSSPGSVTLAPRWSYLTFVNNGSVGVWVRTDGAAAAVGGDESFFIPPSSSMLIANMSPTWSQAYTVIKKGTLSGGTPGTPAEVQPYGSSLAGATVTPGTTVSVILDSGSTSQEFAVQAAG